ncbi:8-amino-7-oxononanoate synthase [Vibrio fluvialis]|uniref:8-amino-7-oxononanoate synthase n=1 Tax=Vibrio fluvialis TaxID=676 RepID=UPI000CEB6F5D|nr:8-amino-7-oxononanoate synthase [Vibrio fluvialis]AVH32798.1 8-amino-7-oxononanoate synthase [Vibrio fluvialis]TOY93986.1 8-amino-7-oxononanoate synthase [Vibrio fluvialis]TRN13546.1 8-amino-7-oxononanoate synthase [Vibrio fluvialis]
MPAFNSRIHQALADREQQGLRRSLQVLERSNQTLLAQRGQRYVNFSSNDYLGLASDTALAHAWQQGLSLYGCGSGASPLVTGFSEAHQTLERTLCEWLGFERAVLFGSGFSANQALLFTLLQKGDLLLQDKLNHASLMEAGMLSSAQMKRFQHNDVDHLTRLLDEQVTTLVVTEGVFSMDGDQAPLAEIQAALGSNAWLAVDDAHGVGVLGERGAGSCQAAGVKPQVLVVTFGKAFGLSGAAILCDAALGDFLTQFARHHVYSTAMPPAQAHALTHAAGMIQSEAWRRDKLAELSALYHELLCDVPGFVATQTPIKPFVLGSAQRALHIASAMREAGLWMTAIRPPTVPSGSARLRITLTAHHTPQQVQQMADTLKQCVEASHE